MSITKHPLANFPMGPNVRSFLGVLPSQYNGEKALDRSEPLVKTFIDLFDEQLREPQDLSPDFFVDLVEELLGMDFAFLVVRFVESFPNLIQKEDFRFCLHYGNSLMMTGDLIRAEEFLLAANRLVPDEPAPYVNLAQIYHAEQKTEQARNWLRTGIHASPNHFKLWEWFASLVEDRSEIATLAEAAKSWAGISLACELKDPNDMESKLYQLYALKDKYQDDPEYLEELTGVMGLLGQYDRILDELKPVLSEGETERFGWKLHLHAAQAYMQKNEPELARALIEKSSKFDDLTDSARAATQALLEELTNP